MPMKFDAVAYFNRAITGRRRVSTRDGGVDSLFAETPEAAARMWLWRLGVDERTAVARVIVWPPKKNPIIETYRGPTIVYQRQEGQLVEVERRSTPRPHGTAQAGLPP